MKADGPRSSSKRISQANYPVKRSEVYLKSLASQLRDLKLQVQASKDNVSVLLDKELHHDLEEDVGCRKSRVHFLQLKVKIAQHRLRSVQQQVDVAQCSIRQRAQSLLDKLKEEQSLLGPQALVEVDTDHNTLLARLAILYARLQDEQRKCISQLLQILPLTVSSPTSGQQRPAVAISRLPLPLSFREVQQACHEKQHHQEKQLLDGLGYVTLLMGLLSRLFELPLLHQSRYCGCKTAIWQPNTFWDPAPYEDNIYHMYITKQDINVLTHGVAKSPEQRRDYQHQHLQHAFAILQRSASLIVHSHPLSNGPLSTSLGHPPFLLLAAVCNMRAALVDSFLANGRALSTSLSGHGSDYALHNILMPTSIELHGSGCTSDDEEWEQLSPADGEDATFAEQAQRAIAGVPHVVASALAKYKSQAVRYLNL